MAMNKEQFVDLAFSDQDLRKAYCKELTFWDYYHMIESAGPGTFDKNHAFTIDGRKFHILDSGRLTVIVNPDKSPVLFVSIGGYLTFEFFPTGEDSWGFNKYMNGDFLPEVLQDVTARYTLFGILPDIYRIYETDVVYDLGYRFTHLEEINSQDQ